MAMDTMRVTQTIPLDMQSPDYAAVVFLRAEINARQHTPFALVRYSISGHERSKALRLDLGKRRFIDPGNAEPGDADFVKATRRLAPVIADRVGLESLKLIASTQGSF